MRGVSYAMQKVRKTNIGVIRTTVKFVSADCCFCGKCYENIVTYGSYAFFGEIYSIPFATSPCEAVSATILDSAHHLAPRVCFSDKLWSAGAIWKD